MDALGNHPAAELFPMMAETAIRELADDIRKNGLLEKIVLYEGKILDGRNRLKACQQAEVPPQFRSLNGRAISAIEYVLSKNLKRRHLTTSQRATIAAKAVPLLKEEAKKRQATSGPGQLGGKPLSTNWCQGVSTSGKTVAAAAKLTGISTSSVERALRVKREDPEEFLKVKKGELTIGAAHRKLQSRRGEYAMRTISSIIRQMLRLSGQLVSVPDAFIATALSAKDRRHWHSQMVIISKSLDAFAVRLRK